jgi:hypothetical protein
LITSFTYSPLVLGYRSFAKLMHLSVIDIWGAIPLYTS